MCAGMTARAVLPPFKRSAATQSNQQHGECVKTMEVTTPNIVLCASILAAATGCNVNAPIVARGLGDTTALEIVDTLWEPQGGYGRIDGLAISSEGALAVADGGSEARLFVIDKLGNGRQVARGGSGPGELRRVSSLAFLDDGSLLVRDMVLARINVYGKDGQYRNQIATPSSELVGQAAMRILEGKYPFVGVAGPPRGPAEERAWALESVDGFGLDARHLDIPYDVVEQCPVVYMQGRERVRFGYAPKPVFVMLRSGATVAGCGRNGWVDLRRFGQAMLRLNLGGDRVERTATERDELKAAFSELIRREVSDWQWSGPDIPEYHPYFSGVYAGEDGSVWIRTPRPSERCTAEDKCAWKLRYGLTVYAESGTLVGVFDVPKELIWRVDPTFAAQQVVAVIEAGDGREAIVRLAVGQR